MKPVAVIASAAISALGRGRAAHAIGEEGDAPKSALRLDPGFGSVAHPLLGQVELERQDDGDRAERLLAIAARDLTVELDREAPGWKEERVGVVIGTSSGAMQSIETALRVRGDGGELTSQQARQASYFSPLQALHRVLGERVPVIQVLAACASSTIAIGLGCRLLESDRFDLVIAGGYDALSHLVACGFDALRALTAREPRPFREDRDGMALGEGVGLVGLRLAAFAPRARGFVLGFGASSDAHHVTAPDPGGAGLERAARFALADAAVSPDDVGLVSAHGTATPFNDAAEARAMTNLFGSRTLPLFPFKAVIGHTLGAAGVLETLATLEALEHQRLPAVPGAGSISSEANVHLPRANEALRFDTALKLSAAFGGANAALVLASGAATPVAPERVRRPVALVAQGPFVERAEPELVARFARVDAAILARLDGFSELVLSAVACLLALLREPPGDDTAVVVGTIAATLEQDELFDRRRRADLPVEPRRFPATSPNLAAGWCGIALGFKGPSFAVGGHSGPVDALTLAHDLVASGDARAALAVRAEDSGPVVKDLFGAAGLPIPRRGACAALFARAAGVAPVSREALAWPDLEE